VFAPDVTAGNLVLLGWASERLIMPNWAAAMVPAVMPKKAAAMMVDLLIILIIAICSRFD
jgi:hypothetical protein